MTTQTYSVYSEYTAVYYYTNILPSHEYSSISISKSLGNIYCNIFLHTSGLGSLERYLLGMGSIPRKIQGIGIKSEIQNYNKKPENPPKKLREQSNL